MRSFSKKLAFVLAAAMVVTAFAPAAKAEAAKEMAINKSSKILYVTDGTGINDAAQVGGGKGNVSVYDFSVKNKPADWKTAYTFAWSTKDDDVVSVAKGGVVTAVGVGKATVYCKVTEKATGEVTTLKTKVTVKANAAKVEITNADKYDGAVVEVNGVVDLNRAMYDAEGEKTTKRGTLVTDYTKWVAEPAAGVEIDQKTGKFTFTEAAVAGEYKLSCYTYQSSKYTKATATSDAVVVEFVKGNTYEVKQTTRDDIVLSFAQATELTVADVSIKETVETIDGTKKVDYLVKSVTASEDKKTYTVAVFYEFNDGASYDVAVKGIEEAVTFVASKGAPKTIVLHSNQWNTSDRTVTVNQSTQIWATLYDAKGVDVTNDVLRSKLSYVVKYADSAYERFDNALYFTEVGEQATVTAEYHTYEYDDKGNEKDVAVSDVFVFYGVAKGQELITGITGYTTTGRFYGDYNVVKLNDNRQLTVKYRTKDFPNDDLLVTDIAQQLYNKDQSVYFGQAGFTSLNPDVLEVYNNAGKVGLYPRKVGTASVMFSYTTNVNGVDVTTPVGTVTIEVKESPVLSSIALDQNSIVICVNPAANTNSENVENKFIKLTAKDQYFVDYTNIGLYEVEGLKGTNALSQRTVNNGISFETQADGTKGLRLNNRAFLAVMNDMNGDNVTDANLTNATRFSYVLTIKDTTAGVYVTKTVNFVVDARRALDVDTTTVAFDINTKDVEFVTDFGGVQWNNNNVARFYVNDNENKQEMAKSFAISLYQLNNGARYDEIALLGELPDTQAGIAAASAGYYYVINKNGGKLVNRTPDYTNPNGVDAEGRAAEVFNYQFSYNWQKSTIDGTTPIVTYDSTKHGAGTYEVILYRIDRLDNGNGGTYGKESRVTSRAITVTCDAGSYKFVSRDEAVVKLNAGQTMPTASQLLACFTIADTQGTHVSHAWYDLDDSVAVFGNEARKYKINLRAESATATDSVFVESITVWESVAIPAWGDPAELYVEYTVPVGYMVKYVR